MKLLLFVFLFGKTSMFYDYGQLMHSIADLESMDLLFEMYSSGQKSPPTASFIKHHDQKKIFLL